MKQVQNKKGVRTVLWLLAAFVLIAVGIGLGICLSLSPDETEAETGTPPAHSTAPDETQPTEGLIDLGNGLVLTNVVSAAGPYPEDGSDDVLPNVLCIRVRNDNRCALRVARVEVILNGIAYRFEMTNLPAGESLYAYEMDRKTAPAVMGTPEAECLFSLFWEEEPSTDADRLAMTVSDRGITVRNISDEDMEADVHLYYKTLQNGIYVGGITYRVTVKGGLKAGDEVTVYAAHATAEHTEIMFVEYEEK